MNDQQAEWEAMKARIRDHQDRQQLEREMLQRQNRFLRIVRNGLITASVTGAILATILVVLVVIGYA
jgi:hypothetical protein